jgi:DNA repair protein RecN (Recombination protein N)
LIERFYLKDNLSFSEVSLEFDKNLIIFSGASGAGKSVLMDSFLSLFGLKECEAKVIEATLPHHLNLEDSGIEEDEPNIFKLNREKSTRYFINNQQISKKNLKNLSSNFINYLSLRDFREFENENLLNTIDAIIIKDDKKYSDNLESLKTLYKELFEKKKRLDEIKEQSKKLTDLKEFATFEIKQIEDIDPKVDEYDELLLQKKELSKKEKIETLIDEAMAIFAYEVKVSDALNLLEEDSTLFDESMNHLRVVFESAKERLSLLDDLNIEDMLERLDKLSSLKTKYGSIQESLEYLSKKKEELKSYENISFEMSDLENNIKELESKIKKEANELSKKRKTALKTLQERTNHYLTLLHLSGLKFDINEIPLHPLGSDEITLTLDDTPLQKVSSGELNRIRLASLAAKSEFIQKDGGVLILDEIDANLSGKESMSVATVLEVLAKTYQIFAISHQPQLSSRAQMHFLVYKEDGVSKVKELKKDEKIDELSRMISGENITKEAVEFAKSLLS